MTDAIRFVVPPYAVRGDLIGYMGSEPISVRDIMGDFTSNVVIGDGVKELVYLAQRKAVIDAAKAEGWMIAREGLADVLAYLGEEVYP